MSSFRSTGERDEGVISMSQSQHSTCREALFFSFFLSLSLAVFSGLADAWRHSKILHYMVVETGGRIPDVQVPAQVRDMCCVVLCCVVSWWEFRGVRCGRCWTCGFYAYMVVRCKELRGR